MSFLSSLLGGIATFGTGGLAGPLISAGASLLGGALNNKAEKAGIAAQNAYNDPAQIRARAEAAGFNPISFIGPGVGNQTAAASGAYMGSAIADAGMAMADGIANRTKRKQAEQLGALEIENAKLQNKLMQLTLRPKVGGVYAQRETTPTIQQAVGGKDVAQTSENSGVGVSSASGRPISDGLSFGGVKLPHDKGTSSADDASGLYGDVVESTWGVGSLSYDLGVAAGSPEFKSWARGKGQVADKWLQRKVMEIETSRRQRLADRPSISLPHPGHSANAWWQSQLQPWWQ